MARKATYKEREQRVKRFEKEVAKHDLAGDVMRDGHDGQRPITDYFYSVRVPDGRLAETIHGLGCVEVTGYTRRF